jgi:hypothetical protein
MTGDLSRVYEFVFRGLLAEEALDVAGRRTIKTPDEVERYAKLLAVETLDEGHI